MKVYIDGEMPKNCFECPFCQDIKINAGMDRLLFCKANKGKAIKNIEKSFDKCIVKNEFLSLADYTKQVRKEACENIKQELEEKEIFHPEDDFEIDYYFYYKEDVENILNQIQGDNND